MGFDINAAEAEVSHHRETLTHIAEIEAALAGEIDESERRSATTAWALQQAVGEFLVASPQYSELYKQLRQAWARLRTIRAVLSLIDHEGHIPPSYFVRWQAEEPLERGMSYHDGQRLVPYEYDEKLLDDWLQALAELQHDTDAALP